MSADTLPFEGITRCGYCNRRLVMWKTDDWRCPRCAPLLDQVKTPGEWILFARRAHRERVKA